MNVNIHNRRNICFENKQFFFMENMSLTLCVKYLITLLKHLIRADYSSGFCDFFWKFIILGRF